MLGKLEIKRELGVGGCPYVEPEGTATPQKAGVRDRESLGPDDTV